MYRIDDAENFITKIDLKSFSDLGYKEREHLQEWIAKTPEVFGEELLIIQKEFDGFNDTNERLDLLALDKQGNLVIIENKLDDSGRQVIWQVLKYASYCSSLTKENIKDIYQDYLNKQGINQTAEESLSDFFNSSDYEEIKLNFGNTQRIIMVAANFRKEVTSTVLWLLNYKLRIQCFKVTPYQVNEDKYINFEQIIPVKDIEEYIISMANKAQSDIDIQEGEKERFKIRNEFWRKYLYEINKKIDLYKNVSPSKDNWISGGTGITGTSYNSLISQSYARVEIYISRSKTDENKFIFDELEKRKEKIEQAFGDSLIWQRLNDKKACRIKYELLGVSYFNEEDWPKMIDFMVESMVKLRKSTKSHMQEVRRELLKYLKKEED